MIALTVLVLMLISGIIGRLTDSTGLFAQLNNISPYITVGLFLIVLLTVYRLTQKR